MINPKILETMPAVIEMATKGQGARIAWPALLRKLDRTDPSYSFDHIAAEVTGGRLSAFR